MNKKLKIGLIVAGLLLVVVLSILVYRKFTEKAKDDTDNLVVDSSKLSITNNQAILISDALLSSMNRYGTDEETIIANLAPLNKNDLLLVIKTFGTKPYVPSGGFLADSWFQLQFTSTEMTLAGWLRAELSGKALETVQQIFINNNIPF